MQGYHIYEVKAPDSISSLVQKLQNTIENLVFLRISEDSLFLFSEANLKLLAYYAREENKDLVFLTRNKELKARLAKLRLPAADSIENFFGTTQKPQSSAELKETAKKAPLSGWAKNTLMAAGVAFVVLFLLQLGLRYWFLPKVTVTLYPQIINTDTEISINLEVLEKQNEIISLKKVATQAATGSRVVGIERAQGEVVFINQGTKQLKLYKGTQLKSKDGKRYLLKEDVLIPGAEVVYVLDVRSSQTAGQALGFIEASELGAEFNVKAGEINILTGDYKDITVRNLKALTGGKSEKRPVVTQADLDLASKEAIKLLLGEKITLKPGEYLLENSITKEEPLIEFDHKAGEFSGTVTAIATQTITVKKLLTEDIKKEAEKLLPELLPSFYSLVTQTVKVTETILEENEAKVRLNMDLYPVISSEEIVKTIAGLSKEEAIEVLETKGKITFEGLKEENLPKRKEWIKVVISDQYQTDKLKTTLTLGQTTM